MINHRTNVQADIGLVEEMKEWCRETLGSQGLQGEWWCGSVTRYESIFFFKSEKNAMAFKMAYSEYISTK